MEELHSVTFDIIWKNEDWTVLEIDENVEYWETPHYNWTTPQKAWDAHYSYVFAWWTPELTGVTQDAVYTATYNSTVNQYRIIFNDEDWTELWSGTYDYWTVSWAINQPETPTKDTTPEYTFTFAWWDPELTGVTEDAVYTATYAETLNSYVVTYDKWTNKWTLETETGNVDYWTLQLTWAWARTSWKRMISIYLMGYMSKSNLSSWFLFNW